MGIMENLPYKCGNLSNCTIANGSDICWTFQKYIRVNKPPVILHKLPNKKSNVTNYDFVNGNDISTCDQAYYYRGELTVKSSMVSTR